MKSGARPRRTGHRPSHPRRPGPLGPRRRSPAQPPPGRAGRGAAARAAHPWPARPTQHKAPRPARFPARGSRRRARHHRRHRGRHPQLPLRMAGQPGRLVQVDHDPRPSGELVALTPAPDHLRAQVRRSRLTESPHAAPAPRQVAVPQHLGNPVHGHQPVPLDREQLQQGARLAAAQATVSEPDTVADHAEYARKVQLQLRANTSSTERVPAHVLFVLVIIDAGKRQPQQPAPRRHNSHSDEHSSHDTLWAG